MRTSALHSAFCALVAAMCCGSSWGQTRPLIQFQHTAWTERDGAPSQINALAQTNDGYLWLGSVSGLFRFDGVRFEEYQLPHGQKLPQTSIWSLAATADGGLWIGYTRGSTSFLKNGNLTNQPFRDNPYMRGKGGTVFSIIVRRDGSTWAATNDGPAKLVSGVWHLAEEADGTEIKTSNGLFEDSYRTLWMTTDQYVYRLPYGAKNFEKTTLYSGGNTCFAETPDRVVWIADRFGVRNIAEPVMANGLYRTTIPVKDETPAGLLVDDSGAFWFLGGTTGITRIRHPESTLRLAHTQQKESLENFSIGDGLTSEVGNAIMADREGALWVATTAGLDRFRRTALTPAPLPSRFGRYPLAEEADGSLVVGSQFEGIYRLTSGQLTPVRTGSELEISCLYRAPDGKIWVGGTAKLGYLQDGRFNDVLVPPKFKDNPWRETQAMTTGPNGDLWIQTNSGLPIYRLHDGAWREVSGTTGEHAQVMVTDPAGRVWAGYATGSVSLFDAAKRTDFKDLPTGGVLALWPDKDGIWIGGQHGFAVLGVDHPSALNFAGGAKIEGISGIFRAEDGSLWLNSRAGVLRVSADEVKHALNDRAHPMQYRLFASLDGLSGKAPQIRPFPSIVRGAGTTLWFITTNGAVSIDTAHISANAVLPPVSINDVLVDGKAFDPSQPIELSKRAKDLQIDYTALSLSIPERVRFRYKLENYDKEWQEAGTRRQAFYTHLPPGRYTFHVIACNDDGLWNQTGASLSIYRPPTFVQSWYFKALLALLFLAATWLIYLLRIKRETARLRERIQERFSERERIARDLHDTLFQSVEGSLLHLNAVTSRLPVEQAVKDQLRQAYGEVDRVMGQARSLVFDLRQPVDAQDLASTAALFAEEVGDLSEVQVGVRVRGAHTPLKPVVYDEVLKIVKECIWNAFRHAQAQHISVALNYSARFFEVSVRDDGVGIDPRVLEQGAREGHWGLPGIRERANALKAILAIRNHEEGGAEVVLKIGARDAYQATGWSVRSPWRQISNG